MKRKSNKWRIALNLIEKKYVITGKKLLASWGNVKYRAVR